MELLLPIDDKYLKYLGQEEIHHLISMMKFRKANKNEVLIPPQKPVKHLFYIQKGIVRLFLPDESGREINTHLAWDGMFITSYYSLIKDQLSDESVVAVTECELYQFSHNSLISLTEAYPKVERLRRFLAEEAFSCLAERGRMLQILSAKERYLYFMKNTPPDVLLQIPLQEIASFLGIAPGSLSRIRNEFLHNC